MDLDAVKNGIVFFSFDDDNFEGWVNSLPLWKKYNAHGTFLISGVIDEKVQNVMKTLQEAGHSIGLHTLNHANAPEFFEEYGAEKYISEQIMPQLEVCRKAGLKVPNFAYPNNRRTPETDAVMLKYFRKLRCGCGCPKEQNPALHEPLFRPVKALLTDHLMGGAGIGVYYNTKLEELQQILRRAAAENQAVVFFSHNIEPDAPTINMPTATLEMCLALAQELGIKVAGFDEIPDR